MTASQGEMVEGLVWHEVWRQSERRRENREEKDTNRKRILFVLFLSGAGNHGVKVWQRARAPPQRGAMTLTALFPLF